MLDAATACILKLLSQNALSQENMATALVDAGYGEPSTDLRLFVRQAINTLQSLRLVCTSEQSVP